MNINSAINVLKEGKKVSRPEWNGMWLEFVNLEKDSFIALKTDDSSDQWITTPDDIVADDWMVV